VTSMGVLVVSPTRVTVAEVARYAGVSSAVVSYVVNDGPRRVAPGTARRVREAIEVLGYRPNSSARALRTGRTGIVGLVLPGTSNPFFGEYADALHAAADRAGVGLLTAGSGGAAASEATAVERIARRDVDGLIVATSISPADISGVSYPRLPTVLVDCAFPVPGYSTVGPEASEGARELVEHLLLVHGHRSVAHVAGHGVDIEPDLRQLGWADAHRRHSRSPGPVTVTDYTRAGGRRGCLDLLGSGPPPSAIFVGSDLQADGVLRALAESGLRVPEDVAVVSFDGTDQSAYTSPPLTVVRQPILAMATAAVETVLDTTGPRHRAFAMDMITRRSCGCSGPPAG